MLNSFFLIYLVLLLLRPNEFVPWLRDVAIMQTLLIVCMALWLFAKDKRLELPQFRLTLWFIVAAMLSVGFAGYWGGALVQLNYIAPIVLMLLLLTTTARDLGMMHRIMVVVILCSCIMVVHGQQQMLLGVGWTGQTLVEGRIRYVGIFSDPNDLGQLFVMAIACCLYLSRRAGTLSKGALAFAVFWLCYGIYLTDSRGTMLAALAVFGIAGIRRYGLVRVGMLGAIAASLLIVKTRFGQISASEESAADRIESWYAGMQMLRGSPVFGVGMGNYINHHHLTAHNSLVLPAAELGLFGFVPWFGILWFTTKMLYWLVRSKHVLRDPEVGAGAVAAEYEAALALMNLAIAWAVSSFFLSQSYKHGLFLVVGLVMARFIVASQLFSDAPRYSVARELPRLVVVSIGIIVAMWATTRVLL